ncbi:ABC transporter ATP-binding protein [Stappia taiwanensis]|uniref:ABC transporter ATP-binding protein n=1 Tax=Stappia taiwanensis TaxID=992267 RepID=A0A838XKN6_9HYPH|nr:ABC transporter ATP-binding protein [Stappia taiwanensis]MBA4610417.1 ABC transporter ATP-binding protein [Stappia taiwanensis]GGE85161.1 ABC transporter ATP-binding protein [Stappia taiwanensis]
MANPLNDPLTHAQSRSDDDVILRARGVTVGFGPVLVLKDLDLDVRKREILGFVGGSGTGKSVLMRAILGLTPRRAGDIEVFGVNLRDAGPEERLAVERRWGVLFQQGALFSSLNVRQNIQVPMREHMRMSERLMDELALLKLEMVGLPRSAAEKFPSELSGGMIKRASLARSLALDPELVFLDEPTAGLDPIGAASFDALILKLRETLGLTVYMVTHDLDSLHSICDRVAVLGEKKVLRTGTIEELMRFDNAWVQSYFNGERALRRV